MIMRSTIRAPHRFRGPQARSPPHNRALRIIAPHGDGADLALRLVRVHRHLRVLEAHPQRLLALDRIAQGLGERTRRQQDVLLGCFPQPEEKEIHHRLAVEGAELELLARLETLLADGGLVGIQFADQGDCLLRQRGLHLLRLEEPPPNVGLIPSSG